MSDPCVRIIATRRASPSLASHAPNVTKIIVKKASVNKCVPINIAKMGISVKIIISRANNDIKRCFRCTTSVIIEIVVITANK